VEVTMAGGAYLKELEDKLSFLEDDWLKGAQGAGIDGKTALNELRSIVSSYK
jgi:hypothetical protein